METLLPDCAHGWGGLLLFFLTLICSKIRLSPDRFVNVFTALGSLKLIYDLDHLFDIQHREGARQFGEAIYDHLFTAESFHLLEDTGFQSWQPLVVNNLDGLLQIVYFQKGREKLGLEGIWTNQTKC